MLKILVLLVMSILLRIYYRSRPEVQMSCGSVRGTTLSTRLGKSFYGFIGIPYAKPPVGDLRFKPPVPTDPWIDIYSATEFHPVCPQVNIYSDDYVAIGNEDCLYLNVYTPELTKDPTKALAVMFYIHGGAFSLGSARQDWTRPDYLLDKDVVLVTVNYRLGALGFLSTADDVLPGNNALKDQALALRWVKDNIVHFGGDPQRITVFGNSAGAVCTQYHMLSPLTQGLINSAIVQSGFAVAFYSLVSNAEAITNAKKLAELLRCPTNSSQEMIECLRKVDAAEIVRQETNFLGYDNDTVIPFRPVVEPTSDDAFLILDPLLTMAKGKSADIPLMTGIVSQEGAYKAANFDGNPAALEMLNNNFEWIAAGTFGVTSGISKTTKAIREFYFGQRNIDNSTLSELTDMFTDGWFLMGADATVRSHFKHCTKPVYKYLFSYRGSVSYTDLFGDFSRDYGVCHTDELLYLLPRGHIFRYHRPSVSDARMIDLLTTLWTNFAKTGNPTPGVTPTIPQKWHRVQSKKQEYYHIKDAHDISMDHSLYSNRMKFWRSLPLKINEL